MFEAIKAGWRAYNYRSRNAIDVENKNYTEIRNSLKSEYANTFNRAGIRFKKGEGLYIKDSYFGGLWGSAARREKFRLARETLHAAIDKEYRDWTVGGMSIADFVFKNLSHNHSNLRLDHNALNLIDEYIKLGMRHADYAGGGGDGVEKMKGHRNVLFKKMENDPENESRRLQAINWRRITIGNKLMRDAIARDLAGGGEPEQTHFIRADAVMSDLTLREDGLTERGCRRLNERMVNLGQNPENLQKLEKYWQTQKSIIDSNEQLHDCAENVRAACRKERQLGVETVSLVKFYETDMALYRKIAKMMEMEGLFNNASEREQLYHELSDNHQSMLLYVATAKRRNPDWEKNEQLSKFLHDMDSHLKNVERLANHLVALEGETAKWPNAVEWRKPKLDAGELKRCKNEALKKNITPPRFPEDCPKAMQVRFSNTLKLYSDALNRFNHCFEIFTKQPDLGSIAGFGNAIIKCFNQNRMLYFSLKDMFENSDFKESDETLKHLRELLREQRKELSGFRARADRLYEIAGRDPEPEFVRVDPEQPAQRAAVQR